jgi:hypothetical protein
LRALDALVFALAAGITVLCAMRVYGRTEGRLMIQIQGRNGRWVYPADRAGEVRIPGPLGFTVVVFSGGGARIRASPCANKTCVASGIIRRRGQWIVCLPNEVSLVIEGARGGGGGGADIDATAW